MENRDKDEAQGFALDPTTQPGADDAPKHMPGELWFLGLLFLITLALLIDSLKLEGLFTGLTNPSSLPQVFILAMLILIVLLAYQCAFKDKFRESNLRAVAKYLISKDVITLLVMVVVYAVLLPYLRFTAASLLFLAVSMYLLNRKQPLKKLLISMGVITVIVLIFSTLMRVVLP